MRAGGKMAFRLTALQAWLKRAALFRSDNSLDSLQSSITGSIQGQNSQQPDTGTPQTSLALGLHSRGSLMHVCNLEKLGGLWSCVSYHTAAEKCKCCLRTRPSPAASAPQAPELMQSHFQAKANSLIPLPFGNPASISYRGPEINVRLGFSSAEHKQEKPCDKLPSWARRIHLGRCYYPVTRKQPPLISVTFGFSESSFRRDVSMWETPALPSLPWGDAEGVGAAAASRDSAATRSPLGWLNLLSSLRTKTQMSNARHPVMDLTQPGEELTEIQSVLLALSNYPCKIQKASLL